MATKRVGTRTKRTPGATISDYDEVLSVFVELLDQARGAVARSVNAIMTATYWEIGRRIVEHEQGGALLRWGSRLLGQACTLPGQGWRLTNLLLTTDPPME
jgi:hypothetical protein